MYVEILEFTNKRGYDPFNSDYFVSILMWMLIFKFWIFHKVVAQRKLIRINVSGSEGYQSGEETDR